MGKTQTSIISKRDLTTAIVGGLVIILVTLIGGVVWSWFTDLTFGEALRIMVNHIVEFFLLKIPLFVIIIGGIIFWWFVKVYRFLHPTLDTNRKIYKLKNTPIGDFTFEEIFDIFRTTPVQNYDFIKEKVTQDKSELLFMFLAISNSLNSGINEKPFNSTKKYVADEIIPHLIKYEFVQHSERGGGGYETTQLGKKFLRLFERYRYLEKLNADLQPIKEN